MKVLAHNADRIPLEDKGLATLLAELSAAADRYGTVSRSSPRNEADVTHVD